MNLIETFIFVHDQKIILEFDSKNRFNVFQNFKYVFLGNREIDKISDRTDVIIARNLEKNIEQYPKLTSFTGWYALVKNGLINSKYVNFFEYDINYVNEIDSIIKEITKKNFDFIGYFPMSINDIVYTKQRKWVDALIDSVKMKTGVDVDQLIEEKIKNNVSEVWSSSSNSTWKTETLIDYVEWFSNFIDNIKNNQYCGHMHERSLSFYYFIKKLNVLVTRGLLTHFQLNSHGTSPLPPERAEKLYKELR
jgi:hypothetical protein